VPQIFATNVKPVLFADVTSLIISNYTYTEYIKDINLAFIQLNEWFNANLLLLNYKKTQHMQFATKSNSLNEMTLQFKHSSISSVTAIKFLGITTESSPTWKAHISDLMPKLSKVCFTMRVIKPILSTESIKVAYHSNFHSLSSHVIIFWGNSSSSLQTSGIQKRIIRIMCGLISTDSCRDSFKKLGIHPLQSQYIYSPYCYL
jgi:hypothetical protein